MQIQLLHRSWATKQMDSKGQLNDYEHKKYKNTVVFIYCWTRGAAILETKLRVYEVNLLSQEEIWHH